MEKLEQLIAQRNVRQRKVAVKNPFILTKAEQRKFGFTQRQFSRKSSQGSGMSSGGSSRMSSGKSSRGSLDRGKKGASKKGDVVTIEEAVLNPRKFSRAKALQLSPSGTSSPVHLLTLQAKRLSLKMSKQRLSRECSKSSKKSPEKMSPRKSPRGGLGKGKKVVSKETSTDKSKPGSTGYKSSISGNKASFAVQTKHLSLADAKPGPSGLQSSKRYSLSGKNVKPISTSIAESCSSAAAKSVTPASPIHKYNLRSFSQKPDPLESLLIIAPVILHERKPPAKKSSLYSKSTPGEFYKDGKGKKK